MKSLPFFGCDDDTQPTGFEPGFLVGCGPHGQNVPRLVYNKIESFMKKLWSVASHHHIFDHHTLYSSTLAVTSTESLLQLLAVGLLGKPSHSIPSSLSYTVQLTMSPPSK